ncbi:sigma-54-dependent Fis family transcriptional regulator [Pyxidicoccus parkwayensis]|uniref:Sigma-54-dependent Fis family transcriptional regulator n=1 Tax=Pyxidicoccus parkwayensis TaxID=2813578 RepID=A0ABX7P2N9_9BACT|nr:sigma-54 dependent transcriptional regulator [Pyxidicoccus parkwaysis]QSQ24653.1 sigma-54-dependent Fis family transcriptional regulator [Pyxidicoccus parkwaysis]
MPAPHPLLLVDDDAAFRKVYGGLLREAGYEVVEAADRPSARATFEARDFPLVLLDLMLPPDGSVSAGLEGLAALLSARPGTKVIVISGAGDTRHTLEAVRLGAYDFLTKPVDPDVLLVVVQRALARVTLERQVESLRTSLARAGGDTALVGQSPPFLNAVSLAERVAASDLPVLVTGENGTGKELLARTVHLKSRRHGGPFVPINCGALPESLLESALFGHVKGSFTGATKDHRGLFAEADGGTLFLDELGDMTPSLQVKVLRALETGDILPVGADLPVKVDVRLISATHQDLGRMLQEGTFREDLYWRVKGVEIRLPPLRERASDLPLLAKHFLNQCAHLCPDGRARLLSDAAAEALAAHAWPGNLRELRHEMQRATVLAGERREIQPEDLSFTGSERPRASAPGATTLAQKVEALERREIEEALKRCGGNRTHTAEALGLSRQGLLKKLERFGLT